MRTAIPVLAAALALPAGAASAQAASAGAPAQASAPAPVSDPAGLVNPFVGTTSQAGAGSGNTFPGADWPFGMLQWSPDTSPHRSDGGGYSYGDSQIEGFSLTHISGPGSAAYGDVPILPTVGPIGTSPGTVTEPFSHSSEQASPGYYQVSLGQQPVESQLTVTPRTGLGQFTYPATSQANFLIKTGNSENGDSAAATQIVGDNEVTGSASSGHFAGSSEAYTVYFAITFDRPFSSFGTWSSAAVSPGSRSAGSAGSGAWITFDASANQVVKAKVGISFVSVANAQQNLQAENPGWNLTKLRSNAHAAWNRLLKRIAISGGTFAEQQTFYTALYHSLLHPNIFSDVNGQYMGFDGKVHTVPAGHASYANYSGWDIYRSQVQLLALLAPQTTSDIVQSMLDDFTQTGLLPKWSLADGETGQQVGDPADPIIADAFAFGARDFSTATALSDMTAEATEPNDNRPGLNYLDQLGYLPIDAKPPHRPVATSLEYNTADFSIGALASAVGDTSLASQMTSRAQDWENLYNPATGFVQARLENGQFEYPFDPTVGSSSAGFVEGSAYQYTYMVPFNVAALVSAEGGNSAFVQRLDTFFTQLNAGTNSAHDNAGNEPCLEIPWEYDYAGAAYQAQGTVRQIVTSLYSNTPDGLPGNDDLGAMSSWYVWSALGMYPETPGSPVLALDSPLFPRAVVRLSENRQLVITGDGASATGPYVHSLSVNGQPTESTWLSATSLLAAPAGTATNVAFGLGTQPDPAWGSAPADAPPSYPAGQSAVIPSLSSTSNSVTVAPGGTGTVTLSAQNVTGSPVTVQVTASQPSGITVSPSPATFTVPADGSGEVTLIVAAGAGTSPGSYPVSLALTANGQAIRGTGLSAVVRS